MAKKKDTLDELKKKTEVLDSTSTKKVVKKVAKKDDACLLYTSPSPRDRS